jgi:hypothetical protein
VAFQEDNGHCDVTNGSLGDCSKNVRARRKKGTLTPDQIAQLEAIGFHWEVRKSLWEKNYAELVAYNEINGHCNVPKEEGSFGSWCDTQRQFRRKGKLSSEQIARLDALGFCWNPFGDAWEKKYAELVAYEKANGDCNPPSSTPLRTWCDNIRAGRKKGELSPEQIARLDALGFCWDFIATLWNKNVAELVAFKKIHGHCNATTWSHGSLGHWCQRVRALRKKGKLNKERYAQLNALGFRWNLKDNDELVA